jgi:DNA primase
MADDQVQQVKQANDIVAVVGERIQLTKAGRNYKALCPFHGEKTPSFFVSAEMQTYKCFGCGVGGDVISFVEAYEGLIFVEALEMLAKRAGITLVKRQPNPGEQIQEELLAICHLASEYYHYLLMEHRVGEAARSYLTGRGVSKQLWRDFKLGYAPDDWDGLYAYLVGKKKRSAQAVEQAGLLIGRDGGGYYDRFRGRVMFPQYDFSGHIVGFAGRLLDPEIKQAKYINTPETKLYHKSKLLYGLYQNKRLIRKADRVVIVEGELDVLSSVKAKIAEVVAVKGSALSEEQVLLLRRLTTTIFLALDADEAGQEAMKRAIQIGEKQGVQLRVVPLEGGKDPDEIVTQSPKRWREMVSKSTSIHQFYIDLAFAQYDATTGNGQKQISQFLAPILAQIENSVERAFYIKKLAHKLDVGERQVETEIAKALSKSTRNKTEVESQVPTMRPRRERLERYVLGVALNLGAGLRSGLEQLQPQWFGETYLSKLVKHLQKSFGSETKKSLSQVKQELSPELARVVDELYSEDQELLTLPPEDLLHIFNRAVADLKELHHREELKRLHRLMSTLDEDDPELVRARANFEQLKREAVNSG